MLPLLLWVLGFAIGLVPAMALLRSRGALTLGTVSALLWSGAGLLIGARWHSRLEYLPVTDALLMGPTELLGGGMRLPLGFVVGALVAGFVCLVTRTSWRDVGDALAVGASVLIPVGRIGCLLNGCCMGTVCGPLAVAAHICIRHPPGTEVYDWQVASHRIASDTSLTLPAHPLPIYFAIASLLTLGVLVVLWRRGAPAGAMLATFCILRPAAKLALEPLRATAPNGPGGLMLVIPVSVLALTCLVLLVGAFRRRRSTAGGGTVMAASLAVLVLGRPDVGRADMLELLARYAEHPLRYRHEMVAAGREHDPARLPELILLAIGDAHLRSGDARGARTSFDALLQREPGEPWESWARFGLGWCAVVEGDVGGARGQFDRVATAGQPGYGVGRLMVAVLDARAGRTASALAELETLAADQAAGLGFNQVARLAAGYARYWAGDFAGAREEFLSLERDFPDEPLADDAAYGAAMARWHAGPRTEALDELDALAHRRKRGVATTRPTRGLEELDGRAILKAGLARYRRLPLEVPGAKLALLLDQDGVALARAAHRRLAALARSTALDDAASPERAASSTSAALRASHDAPLGTSRDEVAARDWRWIGWTASGIALFLFLRRRRTAHG